MRGRRACLLLLLAGCGGDDDATGPSPADPSPLVVAGGGDNVLDRCSSDLWVHGAHAYTGTWGGCTALGRATGNAVLVWSVAGGAPVLVDSVLIADIGTVSDLQVTADGATLVVSAEGGAGAGLHLFSLADPDRPAPVGEALIGNPGIHTVTVADVAGGRYAFAARNPGSGNNPPEPALLVYDITDAAAPALVAERALPREYGVHDTFVRDGIAFVFAWNTGVVIYDVGDGIAGGSPSDPVELSRFVTAANGVPGGPAVHNGWWFHNPVNGERRYLFIGQEGPGSVAERRASGDIHVVDVSDLRAPREVATYRLPGAGAHNFWMDEARQILYAAYYNGGVVALDVSGTLSGSLAEREIARTLPGGAGQTYVWGVQLAGGSVYATDMLTGLWQLQPTGERLAGE